MDQPPLGVGMVGYAFMGAAHSQAWRTAPHVFALPRRPVLAVLCGRDEEATRAAAGRYGFASVVTDWRDLLDRDDVAAHRRVHAGQLARGDLHRRAGRGQARAVREADGQYGGRGGGDGCGGRAGPAGGVRAMVGFNYRRVPAIALARQLVAAGRIGTIRHVRASYLQDWLADPAFPLTWRLRREQAGSGALGDLGSHLVDLAQHLTGQLITGVSAASTTFINERQLAAGPPGRTGAVTVDDAVTFSARLGPGTLATFEATRFAAGRKNALRIELNGAQGSLAFDLERLNELEFYDRGEDAATAGFRRVLVTEPGHPYLSAWWPPGHVLGWEHTFVHQARDLVDAIAAGTDPAPSFADGLQVQRVLAAVADSAATDSQWTPVAAAGH